MIINESNYSLIQNKDLALLKDNKWLLNMEIDTEVIVYNQYSLWILHYWINLHFQNLWI